MDGRLLPAGSAIDASFCVIGTGMGGSAVAQALAAGNQDVLLVEAGGIEPASDGNAPITAEHVGKRFALPLTRAIGLGGTSSHWHGGCGVLDGIDFEQRPWVEGSGWPIERNELMPFYDRAARQLGASGAGELEANSLNGHFRERLGDLQFDRSVLLPKVIELTRPPRRWKDALLKLARDGTLRCLLNAPALELVMDEYGHGAASLIVGVGSGTATVRARNYVICAGALETPRLLLNSRRRSPEGLGNSRDLVGRYLSDHPMGHFCKLRFRRPTRAPLYASMRMGPGLDLRAGLMTPSDLQRRHGLSNNYVWIRPCISPARIDDELLLSFLAVRGARDLTLRQIRAALTNRDILYRILVQRFGMHPSYRYGDLFFLTEQFPNRESRVRLSARRCDRNGYPTAEIDWRLSDRDFRGFEAYSGLVLEHGLRSGQYAIVRRDPLPVWIESVTAAAHHVGTARMADHPGRGVVDGNLQVFGTRNVFVCDGSVFPTAGSVNPALTIYALGLRLGEHLLACKRS